MKAGPLIVFIVSFVLIVISFLVILPVTRMGYEAYKHYMWISSSGPLLISLGGIIWGFIQSDTSLLKRAGIIGNSVLVVLMSFKFYQFLVLFVL